MEKVRNLFEFDSDDPFIFLVVLMVWNRDFRVQHENTDHFEIQSLNQNFEISRIKHIE